MTRAFGFRHFEDIFKESYGEGHRTFEFRRPGLSDGLLFLVPAERRPGAFFSDGGTVAPQIRQGIFGKLLRYSEEDWGLRSIRGKDWQDISPYPGRHCKEER